MTCVCGTAHSADERFYVTCVDAGRVGYLAGPFTEHTHALAQVDPARRIADRRDVRAWFYAFGTVGVRGDSLPRGILNTELGL